jgi:hypothetical protein
MKSNTNKLRSLTDNTNVTNKIYNMNREFFHTTLIKVTNLTIKAVMVSLTLLAVSGIGLVITKLLQNPESFSTVGGLIK